MGGGEAEEEEGEQPGEPGDADLAEKVGEQRESRGNGVAERGQAAHRPQNEGAGAQRQFRAQLSNAARAGSPRCR